MLSNNCREGHRLFVALVQDRTGLRPCLISSEEGSERRNVVGAMVQCTERKRQRHLAKGTLICLAGTDLSHRGDYNEESEDACHTFAR